MSQRQPEEPVLEEQPLEDDTERPRRKLTRNERLQLAADYGIDTWDDYKGEK